MSKKHTIIPFLNFPRNAVFMSGYIYAMSSPENSPSLSTFPHNHAPPSKPLQQCPVGIPSSKCPMKDSCLVLIAVEH